MILTDSDVKRLLDIAAAGLHKGEVTLARRVYEGVLEARPGFAPALISLALSHIVVGEYDEGERILREDVLAKNAEDADAKAYLGLSRLLSGHADEARALLEELPADTTARHMLETAIEHQA